MTDAERTLAAECRAVTEGHRARLADGVILVASDTLPDVSYRVKVEAVGETVWFACDHAAYVCGQPGRVERTVVPCKHGALAARRLEREGILRWELGRWVPTVVVAPAPLRLVMPGAPRVEL